MISIGIDLGTTFSSVAEYNPETLKATVIPDEGGSSVIPSVVSFDPRSRRVLVGHVAKGNLVANPGSTIVEVKRELGKTFEDTEFRERHGGWSRWCGGISNTTRFRATANAWTPFGRRCCACGTAPFNAGASAVASAGRALVNAWLSCSPPPEFCNPTRTCASTPSTPRSEVRTVCAKRARTGLCGGQRASAVPTATDSRSPGRTWAWLPERQSSGRSADFTLFEVRGISSVSYEKNSNL